MRLRKERRRKGTSISGQTVITKVDAEDEYVDDNETTFTVRPKLTIDQLLDDSDEENEQHLGSISDARTIATTRTTASTRRRKQQSALWIKEGGQTDDPIDLTEPTAARSIYGQSSLSVGSSVNAFVFSDETVDKSRNRSDETGGERETKEFAISNSTGWSANHRRGR